MAVGFPTRQNVLWSDGGQRLGAVPLGQPLPDGTVSQTLKRARLGRALEDEASGAACAWSSASAWPAPETTPDGGVVARFEDGSTASRRPADRRGRRPLAHAALIDPSAPSGRYVGLTNFGGYTPTPGSRPSPRPGTCIFGRRAFFGYMPRPLPAAPSGSPTCPARRSPRTSALSTSAGAWQRQLVDLFAADHGPAADLIRRGELDLAADNTFDLPHVPIWHRGPMLVIGDAAHAPSPSSGQGASMAMEDAVVLARCLRDLPAIPDAFVAYERLRRARVERIVAQGARSSSVEDPRPGSAASRAT